MTWCRGAAPASCGATMATTQRCAPTSRPYFNYLVTLDDVVASRGGNPLMMGGKVIGAIGVSGGSGAQDDVLSQAGVAALK